MQMWFKPIELKWTQAARLKATAATPQQHRLNRSTVEKNWMSCAIRGILFKCRWLYTWLDTDIDYQLQGY